jgi:hypothetical protein
VNLNKETVEILRNFASINANLVIKPGKKITTMSVTKDILATYEGEVDFTKQVSIFNLSEFLGAYAAFSDPEIELNDKNLVIKKGKQQVKYVYADENVLITPKKDIIMPSAEIEIELTNELITRLSKMASVLSVEDLAVIGDGKTVCVKVYDKKNPTANAFEVDLEVQTTRKFHVNFKVEKLRLFPSDYKVEISSKKISKWIASSLNLVVFIAVEADSTFN